MKTVPATLRLIDFSAEASDRAPEPEVAIPPVAAIEHQQVPEPLMSQQEFNEAVSQVRIDLEADCARQVQEVRDDCDRQLESARLQALEERADHLVTKVSEEFSGLGQELAERLFEKCRPVLGALGRDQAVGELAEVLSGIARTNWRIEARGPADLLAALRSRLGGQELEADWHEEPVADISIKAGDTIVETQLSGWLGDLTETADG